MIGVLVPIHMDTMKLRKQFKWLTISFVVIALWWGTAIFLVWNKDEAFSISQNTIALLVGFPGIVASWVFIINLWRLARTLNRSPIVWVGLTLIFSPIGPLVAYSIMRQKVLNALQDNVPTNKHSLITIKGISNKQYIVMAAIVVMLGIIFGWNKFSPHQAVGEWHRDLCINKNNYLEDLVVFKDGTAITWLTSRGRCYRTQNFHSVCPEDSSSWGKIGCDWSAKSENMILLRCHVSSTDVSYRAFKSDSRGIWMLDDKDMYQRVPKKNDAKLDAALAELYNVATPVCSESAL